MSDQANVPNLAAMVRQFWAAHTAVQLNGPLVVGVSGGADSLSLLHALTTTAVVPLSQLTAVYVHHGLRPEADDEAQFVRTTAHAWGVTGRVKYTDTPDLVERTGYSVEEAARIGRYTALLAVAREVGAQALVVAHTADDQAETVLMHLMRGSGVAGLRGMQPLSRLPATLSDGQGEMWVARPFLSVWRTMITAYCRTHGLTPRQDASNQDTTFFRNALRHDLLPYLKRFSPRIKERLHHTADIMTAEDAVLANLTTEAWHNVLVAEGTGWVRFSRRAWSPLAVAVQRRLLRRAVQRVSPVALRDVGFATLEQARHLWLLGQVGQQATLPGAVQAVVGYDTVWLRTPTAVVPPEQNGPQVNTAVLQRLPVPGRLPLADGWRLTAVKVATDTLPDLSEIGAYEAYLAVPPTDALGVRGRQPGERFAPLGLAGHTVKLKEMMIDRKIPAVLRARWPLVTTADGDEVLWVVGQAQAESTAVRSYPPLPATAVLKLTVEPPDKPASTEEKER